uniref:Eukaryotic translation initiation factor 3 subunit G n=1 Tax=Strigamia maritima TaxID=126957 RepID=T1IR28_STRMM
MPSAESEVKSSWADQVEEGEDTIPLPTEIFDKGYKTVTEYKLNEDGKKVKVIRQYKVETRIVSKSIAKRKTWKKFGAASKDKPGPNPATTTITEDIYMQFITNKEEEKPSEDDALAKIRGTKMVRCRICKEDHWTTQCPYKDTLGPLQETLKGDEKKPAAAGSPAATDDKPKTGKYVPPSLRDGGNRRGESMQPTRRDETATIRVTNLSEDTRESDLQDLFRPFGSIARIYLAKDKTTGQSKGFAFINFHHREDAAKAIAAVSGFGYDHLILSVEWANYLVENMLRTVVLFFLFTNGIGGIPCPPLPFVEHGTYKVLRGNKVKIICELPYVYRNPKNPLEDSTVIFCKKGNWSNPEPECQLPQNNCEPPKPIENGKYIGFPPFNGESTIQVYCDEGYILKGPTARKCHPTSFEWTNVDPYCMRYDPSIAGIADRIDSQFDKMNNISNTNREIGYNVEFLGLDLFLIFDKSSSITPLDFKEGIRFAQFLIDRFNISNGDIFKEGGTRLSILTFGDSHAEIVALDDISVSSTEIAKQKLESIQCGDVCDGSTNMAAALERVDFVVSALTRDEAKKAVFLTSDGVPNDVDAVNKAVASLKKHGSDKVEIYTIGIGNDVDIDLLKSIASSPPAEHFFLLDKFSDFNEMIKTIREKPTPTPPPSLDKCGYLTEVGKKAAKPNPGTIDSAASPWLAAIIIADGHESKFNCSGALICSQWVLTTASCLHKNKKVVQETDVYVILGENNLAKNSGTEQYFYAEEIHINDNFTFGTIQDDLALIKLNTNTKFNDNVRTVCVPKAERISTRPDSQLLMTGWLITNEESSRLTNEPVNTIKPSQTNLTVLAIDDCETKIEKPIECKHAGTGAASIGNEHLVKCTDNSGSLLTTTNERFELIGLAVKGRGCNIDNKLAFFVRISMYYDWIDDITTDCIENHIN